MKPRVIYKEILGIPDHETMQGIFHVMGKVFDKLHLTHEQYLERLKERRLIFTIVAMHQEKVIGFKLGYEKSPTKFVSQLGGVLPKYRGHGIAQELMIRQHRWCFKKRKYKSIQTESMNRYKDMMALNLKHEFAIIGTYYDKAYDELKIIFEKRP